MAYLRRYVNNKKRGQQFEKQALAFLKRKGLKLVRENYNCRMGEIDLIMKEHDTLVFIEVRYRNTTQFGTPAETVDHRKQHRLTRAAQIFLRSNQEYQEDPARFDIIGITDYNGNLEFEWHKNALEVPEAWT
ncbi:MAG: YraN family protein [Gammaproteobacteria bacterium]